MLQDGTTLVEDQDNVKFGLLLLCYPLYIALHNYQYTLL
jgi:hypothetical protein